MGDDEGVHHNFCHLLPSLFGRLLSVLVVLLSEGLVHVMGRCDLHIHDDLLSLFAMVASQPHKVRLQLRSGYMAFLPHLVRSPVFGPNGDFVMGRSSPSFCPPTFLVEINPL